MENSNFVLTIFMKKILQYAQHNVQNHTEKEERNTYNSEPFVVDFDFEYKNKCFFHLIQQNTLHKIYFIDYVERTNIDTIKINYW